MLQLVIDKSLAALPRRQTDNSIIIRSRDNGDARARVFKLNAVAEEPIFLERFASNLFRRKFQVTYRDSIERLVTRSNIVSIAHDVHSRLDTNLYHLP